jgi:hypothetical protein
MWYTPVAMRSQDETAEVPVNTGESFADRRAGGRMYFIHQAETILRAFVDVMTDAHSVRPPVNSSILFEIEHRWGPGGGGGKSGGIDATRAAANSGFSKSGTAIKTGTQNRGSSSGSRGLKSPGLLSEFLSHMDEAAVAFSHLDFAMAELSLLNAEAQIDKLRQRLSDILHTRSGYLVCKNPSDTVLQHEASKVQQLRLMRQWMGKLWGRKATQRRERAITGSSNQEEGEGEGEGDASDQEGKVLGLSVGALFSIVRFIVQIFLLVGFIFLARLAGAKCRQVWTKTTNKHYL